MSVFPDETPHTIESVGKRVIEAIENQTKAMGLHTNSMNMATYVLAAATIILAGVTLVGWLCP